MPEVVPVSNKKDTPKEGRRIPVWLKRILIGLGVVGTGSLLVLGLLPLFIDGESFRKPLQEALSSATRREVLLGELKVQTFGGIGLKANRLRVVRSDGTVELQARGIFVELALLPLLTRKLEAKLIELDGVQVDLSRDRAGRWNFQDLIDERSRGTSMAVNLSETGIRVLNSTVNISDVYVQPNQVFQVSNLDLNLERLERTVPLRMQATLANAQGKLPVILTVDGTLALPGDGNWQQLGGNVRILAKKLRPRLLEVYTRDIPSLAGLAGVFDLDLNWKGRLDSQFRIDGTVDAPLMRWDWQNVFGSAPWLARDLLFDAALIFDARKISAERLKVTGTGLDATISGTVSRPTAPEEPVVLDLALNTGLIDPFAARKNLPLNVLPVDTRGWVADSKGTGKLSTDLVIRGPVERTDVTGTVEFRDFKLSNPRLRHPIEGLNGKVVLGPQVIELMDLRVGPRGNEATVAGTIGRGTEGAVALKVTSAAADLGSLAAIANSPALSAYRIDGRSKLDLAVSGTAGRPQVLGRAELQGASVRRQGWPEPLRDLQGTLAFDPTGLILENVTGGLGRSSFSLNGSITGYGTDTANPQLTISSSALDLGAAEAVLDSDLAGGTFRRRFRQTFRSLDGEAAVDLKVQGSQTTGRVELQGATLGLNALNTPLQDARGTVLLSEKGTTFERLDAQIAGSPVTLKGTLSWSGDIELGGEGTLNFPQAVALLPPKNRGQIKARGSAPASFTLNGPARARELQGVFDLSGLTELTLNDTLRLAPARRLTIGATLSPQRVTLKDTQLELSEVVLDLNGTIDQFGAAAQRYDLRVRSDRSVEFATLSRLVVPVERLGVTAGTTNLDLTVTGPASAPGFGGTLNLSAVRLPNLLGGLEGVEGILNFAGERVSTDGLTFRLTTGGSGRLSGSLQNFKDPSLNFDARLERLDLDGLLASATPGGAERQDLIENARGRGTVSIENGTLSRLSFSGFTAQVNLERGIWELSDLSVNTAGGKMTGAVRTDVRLNVPEFSGELVLRGAEANQLASQWLDFGNQVFGSTDMTLNFRAAGSAPEQFLGSLNGSGSLLVQNGRLASLDLLGPIFGAADNIRGGVTLNTVLGALGGLNTGKFQKFGGSFTLRDGVASTNDFAYAGPNLRLRTSGTLQMVNRDADLQVQGDFTQTGGSVLGTLFRRLRTPGGSRAFAFEVAGPINQVGSVRNLRWSETSRSDELKITIPGLGDVQF